MSERANADRHEPGRYEIRLRGHLGARWAIWFDGLSLTRESDGSTTLRGEIPDQAALHGVLQRVRDTGLPLVSVVCLEAEPAEPAEPAETPAADPLPADPASRH